LERVRQLGELRERHLVGCMTVLVIKRRDCLELGVGKMSLRGRACRRRSCVKCGACSWGRDAAGRTSRCGPRSVVPWASGCREGSGAVKSSVCGWITSFRPTVRREMRRCWCENPHRGTQSSRKSLACACAGADLIWKQCFRRSGFKPNPITNKLPLSYDESIARRFQGKSVGNGG